MSKVLGSRGKLGQTDAQDKGTVSNVYFDHLRFVATLVLLFLVRVRREGLSDETKGTVPKVYFYHLWIVATLVLLFLVREEKGRTIR